MEASAENPQATGMRPPKIVVYGCRPSSDPLQSAVSPGSEILRSYHVRISRKTFEYIAHPTQATRNFLHPAAFGKGGALEGCSKLIIYPTDIGEEEVSLNFVGYVPCKREYLDERCTGYA